MPCRSPKGTPGEFTQVFGALPPDLPVAPVPPPRPIPPASDVPPSRPARELLWSERSAARATSRHPTGRVGAGRTPQPRASSGESVPDSRSLAPNRRAATVRQRSRLDRPQAPVVGDSVRQPWPPRHRRLPRRPEAPRTLPSSSPRRVCRARWASARLASPSPEAHAAGASSEQPSERRSYLSLVLILAALLLCAAGLVVYFAVTAG